MEDSDPGLDVGVIELDLPALKSELILKYAECSQRGLMQSSKWLAEILFALKDVKCEVQKTSEQVLEDDYETYVMAKSYFDLKEYDRVSHFTKDSKSSKTRFLHYYSRYLSGEKKRLDNSLECVTRVDAQQLSHLKDIRSELQKLYNQEMLDGYCLYIYGIVLKRLSLNDMARNALIESIKAEPGHWGSWHELSCLITDRNTPQELDLPDHWIKHFFLAHTYLELQLNEQALSIYFRLQSGGLQESTYILAQVAIAFHNMREVDQAIEYFKKLSENDPCRLDNLDTYSNLLYVKEQRVELGHLAHRTVQIDKYRTETCCVIGNYYSLRFQHEKAVVSFQRALKLNPYYLSAWTLMGHEFMELKNITAAIQSYRHALEVNRRDYRAWYGLGQTYEILKMPFYCLYYYKQAQELRPSDSRMLVALGESYEKMGKYQDAMKCFWKAHCVGDIEGGIALYQLAKLYELIKDTDQAAAAYSQYIENTTDQGVAANDRDHQSKAHRYLAQYYLNNSDLDEAYHYAQKCAEFADTCEEGKAILREIAARRGVPSALNPPSTTEDGLKPKVASSHEDSLTLTRSRFTTDNPRFSDDTNNPETTSSNENNDQNTSIDTSSTARRDLEPMNLTFTP
ncbi:anaphase-promoting complex subunit 8 isoform X1 [Lepeophtheirus salmonis]|uniref:anaphase-promoting complex subunit 8 isoform X1 n=1 Tax=Lepeophtheirus salmonis TaxID=72036 RepID=UPI001AE8545A|nr:cell division cycle protein 23 homolog isoform X1 [Lepeophtheirus salmonis]